MSVFGELRLSEVLSQEFLLTRFLSGVGDSLKSVVSLLHRQKGTDETGDDRLRDEYSLQTGLGSTHLSNSVPLFSPKHSKCSPPSSSGKSLSCLSSGEVELSAPIAESASVPDCGL